jgi:putative membrane protein
MKSLAMAAALAALPLACAIAAPSSTDKMFVRQAAIGGLAEVQEGQLAQQMASSADVKQFGQTMVQQHTENNNELMQVAQQEGITVSPTLDAKHRKEAAMLQKKSGTAFDKTYVNDQIAGHKAMAQVMQSEITHGSDPALKAFAQKTLPVVQQHLQMAQQLSAG